MSARDELARVLSSAVWPDGGRDGFPTKRIAEMLADAVLSEWLPAQLEVLRRVEAERDSAQEHLAYHLSDYALNSEKTGDLAVDMASWARRQRAERDAALAENARLRALGANTLVHNHPPYEPPCTERRLPDGQLRGDCLNDDGSAALTPPP